ncbi:DUF6428 family protein [Marinoscillum furvescens]|uniref:Uncharacterized protein n=1 Tax=Marinoscillum furvescens DSM 4134 TaxID=1122208 RepID=A0A3D9KX86_MARFU|nr:DUF6428 family protein [Marinoscillum furvescens]RED92215.1 hypothetical protein C7460_13227 [Marinoscillum furvescens DSM 4134]
MKLSEIKSALAGLKEVTFVEPSGKLVPAHFHVTEIGAVHKHFIDCGGTERKESVISLQLWTADDFDHRLGAQRFAEIIAKSEEVLQLEDLDVEVEYQGETIGKYGLEFRNGAFYLTPSQTACLAPDQCGVPASKPKVKLSELQNSCAPGSGCC